MELNYYSWQGKGCGERFSRGSSSIVRRIMSGFLVVKRDGKVGLGIEFG